MTIELDRTEMGVLRLLQQDGRMSFVEMAERLGVAEATVRRKFHRLVNEGVVRIAAVTDALALGFQTPVVMGLKVRTRDLPQVAARLQEFPNVRYVAAATGQYDLVVEAIFKDNEELSRFVLDELGDMEGILETNTSLLLKVFKQSHGWLDERIAF